MFTSTDCEMGHTKKIDELGVYETDRQAAEQEAKDGFKIITDLQIIEDSKSYYFNGTILDTPENRKKIKEINAAYRS